MFLPSFDPAKADGFIQPTKGMSIAADTEVSTIPTQQDALPVVVEVSSAQKRYAVLVSRRNGLCEGYRVERQDVYFFSELKTTMRPRMCSG